MPGRHGFSLIDRSAAVGVQRISSAQLIGLPATGAGSDHGSRTNLRSGTTTWGQVTVPQQVTVRSLRQLSDNYRCGSERWFFGGRRQQRTTSCMIREIWWRCVKSCTAHVAINCDKVTGPNEGCCPRNLNLCGPSFRPRNSSNSSPAHRRTHPVAPPAIFPASNDAVRVDRTAQTPESRETPESSLRGPSSRCAPH
jgi:hypothetical protein